MNSLRDEETERASEQRPHAPACSRKKEKINGKRVRRPSTSQKCHPASLAFWRSSLWERNPLDAKATEEAERRVGHIDKFNAVAIADRVLARGPRLRSRSSVPQTLYTFAQDTLKYHWCGSELSFRAEDTHSIRDSGQGGRSGH